MCWTQQQDWGSGVGPCVQGFSGATSFDAQQATGQCCMTWLEFEKISTPHSVASLHALLTGPSTFSSRTVHTTFITAGVTPQP